MISDRYQDALFQVADEYSLAILRGRTFNSLAMAPAYDEARFVSERQFNTVTCAMVAVASIFTTARVYIQVWKRRPMQSQDYLLYAAFVFFLVMSICYISMAPKIYMIGQVSKGLVQPPETLMADVVWCTRVIFVSQTSFLLALWLVKLSLLALYRKLIKGLPIIYLRIWWAVSIFCLLVSRLSMGQRQHWFRSY